MRYDWYVVGGANVITCYLPLLIHRTSISARFQTICFNFYNGIRSDLDIYIQVFLR